VEIPILFGRFLVRQGKISEEALLYVTKVQTEINQCFSAVALESDFISLDDFKKALNYQRESGIKFSEALKELKIANDETIEKINDMCRTKRVKLGELLVKRGFITEDDLKTALEEFKNRGAMELL
jgi:hypothetical protein